MAGAVTRIGRKRAKTWSSFGELGRKPSEYEIVTHNMNHTWRETGGEPLEMGPEVQGNVWLRDHRDAKLFGVRNWNDFRDPDELTYRKYCTLQDAQETYVDELLKNFSAIKNADSALSDNTLQFLQTVMTPTRYLAHGQQMMAAYVQQVAPSSYVGNCATFETADTLRRTQRVAYRTKQLDNAHPLRGFGTSERGTWEGDAGWQPIRRAVEQLLTEFDFDRTLVFHQLVAKPILDNLFLQQFAAVARSLGTELDALIAENLYVDTKRAEHWTIALTRFIARNGEGGSDGLRSLLAEAREAGESLIIAGADLLARHATPRTAEQFGASEKPALLGSKEHAVTSVAEAIRGRVRNDWSALINEAGLGGDA